MSELPSRDIAAQITKAFDVRGLAADRAAQAMRIIEAYAKGRLIDPPHTIDHNAITVVIIDVASRVDSEGVTGDFHAEEYTDRIVAAIGGSDEK